MNNLHQSHRDNPLFVDLDGTFIKSDILFENILAAIKHNIFNIFWIGLWVLRGKAYLKHMLAQHHKIDATTLPLNIELFDYLQGQKRAGRAIILATGSNETYAKQIVEHSKLFESYISSDKLTNLTGKAKLSAITHLAKDSFSYAGNDLIDLPIFAHADEVIIVNPSIPLRKQDPNSYPKRLLLDDKPPAIIKDWTKQLRLHQWLKNILIFVPLIVSGKFLTQSDALDHTFIGQSILAFIAFSLLASATYIINDLLDLHADRQHQSKRYRPLAAGNITIPQGMAMAALLFVSAVTISLYINHTFMMILGIYLTLTLCYSFEFKRIVAMDTVVLSMLYTLRIIAGAYAIESPISFWLLSFSVFIFLSLALVKRCAEIKQLEQQGRTHTPGRSYQTTDYPVLLSFGACSALMSVLMLCFYINNNALTNQYQAPTLLIFIVPILIYWLMRVWMMTQRGEMTDDPIIFALTDTPSLYSLIACMFLTFSAQITL